MAAKVYFTKELFKFMRELKANNNREWFNENKPRYEEHVKAPFLSFIGDFAGPLEKISKHMRADPRPVGGSLFRIYRDVRFSKNKDPYKTAAGGHFRHELAKDAYAPGYYLHLEPDNVFIGLGIWHPDSKTLRKIRDHIVDKPDEWRKIVNAKCYKDGSLKISGDSLKRAPQGFDPEHPLIDDLKRKDFTAFTPVSEADVMREDFMDRFAEVCKKGAPFMRFICDGIGVPF